MSKHSNFPRRAHDEYLTPFEAALPLAPYLTGVRTFAEPCCADGRLIRHVESFGPLCIHSGDIQTGTDALEDPELRATIVDAIITNPPYTWPVLKAMLDLFPTIAPTWFLLEADFKHNARAAPYIRMCTDIVSVGRVRWFADTKHEGKANYAWMRFHVQHTRGPVFHPRSNLRAIQKQLEASHDAA